MRVRLTNVRFVDNGFDADVEVAAALPPPIDPLPVVPPPVVPPVDPTPPPISRPLPAGYDSDEGVAFTMLTVAMDAHGLTPIGVQGHGTQIADALNATWPGLNAYADKRSDAVMWPGFGDLDVTIDSGKGGWSFQVGHHTPYEPDPSKR